MGKGSKAPDTARLANTAVVNATKGKIGMQKVHHRLVDAGVTSAGFLQNLVGHLIVFTVDIKRQRLWSCIDIANDLINVRVSNNWQ